MSDHSTADKRCTCTQCVWNKATTWGHEDLTAARERVLKIRDRIDILLTTAVTIFPIAVAGILITFLAGLGLDLVDWYNPFNEILSRTVLLTLAVTSGLGAWMSSSVWSYLYRLERFLQTNVERFETAHRHIYELHKARQRSA